MLSTPPAIAAGAPSCTIACEAIATAWRLYDRTGRDSYRADFHRLWNWSWDHLVDHRHGAWYRITSREGDWIEIDQVGAYSNALATHFNGFFPETFVLVQDPSPAFQEGASEAAA